MASFSSLGGVFFLLTLLGERKVSRRSPHPTILLEVSVNASNYKKGRVRERQDNFFFFWRFLKIYKKKKKLFPLFSVISHQALPTILH